MVFLKLVTTLLILTLASPALASNPPTLGAILDPEASEEDEARLELVKDWIKSFMIDTAPPGRKIYHKDGQETIDDTLKRYDSIADDLVSVVYDPNTKPVFKGPDGRARTISLILSVMLHESGFMKHVDYGLGAHARGDEGESWCLMQLHVGDGRTMKWNTKEDRPVEWNDPEEDIAEGYTGPEMVKNRRLCIAEGLKILRISFASCSGLPLEDRLRLYASGSCEKGSKESRNRVGKAIRWFAKSHQKQFTDEQILLAFDNQQRRRKILNEVVDSVVIDVTSPIM